MPLVDGEPALRSARVEGEDLSSAAPTDCMTALFLLSARFVTQQHCVARVGGANGLSLTLIRGHATRTYSGRPRPSMRFSASAAIATSVA